MTILLWRRHGAGRDHGAALWCLGPGHELLIGPVPAPLPVRVGLQSLTHLPLPHRCLPPQTPPAGKGNSPEAAHASGATPQSGAVVPAGPVPPPEEDRHEDRDLCTGIHPAPSTGQRPRSATGAPAGPCPPAGVERGGRGHLPG